MVMMIFEYAVFPGIGPVVAFKTVFHMRGREQKGDIKSAFVKECWQMAIGKSVIAFEIKFLNRNAFVINSSPKFHLHSRFAGHFSF